MSSIFQPIRIEHSTRSPYQFNLNSALLGGGREGRGGEGRGGEGRGGEGRGGEGRMLT